MHFSSGYGCNTVHASLRSSWPTDVDMHGEGPGVIGFMLPQAFPPSQEAHHIFYPVAGGNCHSLHCGSQSTEQPLSRPASRGWDGEEKSELWVSALSRVVIECQGRCSAVS